MWNTVDKIFKQLHILESSTSLFWPVSFLIWFTFEKYFERKFKDYLLNIDQSLSFTHCLNTQWSPDCTIHVNPPTKCRMYNVSWNESQLWHIVGMRHITVWQCIISYDKICKIGSNPTKWDLSSHFQISWFSLHQQEQNDCSILMQMDSTCIWSALAY